MSKKKIKLTKAGKIYFSIIIILLIILTIIFIKSLFKKEYKYLDNSNNTDNSVQIIDKSLEFIINSSESDSDIINTIFANGMNLNEFKEVYNQVEYFVNESGSYQQIDYDFDRKLHYSDIEEILYNINNSDIAKLEIIGKSADNRNIYGLEIGNGDKVLYLDANIHAAEVATTTFLTMFLSDLTNKYENGNKDVINVLNDVKIAIIPCINPDGYEVYNFGIESLNNKDLWMYQNRDSVNYETFKYNANGVDLNRNFPTQNAGLYYKEKKLISSVALEKTTKRYSYYGGESLGSEPETKASMYFMLKHYKNAYAYINLHSQGRVIYAGKPNLSSEFNNITLDFAGKVSDITGYYAYGLSSEEVGEGNDGSVSDFFAEIVNGFKFSSETLRLSTDKYKGDVSLKYNVPIITLETLNTYTNDPSVFKNEYYNHGIEELLYSLILE